MRRALDSVLKHEMEFRAVGASRDPLIVDEGYCLAATAGEGERQRTGEYARRTHVLLEQQHSLPTGL